jgi:ADP-heptose:LPS heptosyltransferase
MAQTWPVSRTRRAALKTLDFFGRAAFAPVRALRDRTSLGAPRRILVVEPWNIGDVVLATPILSALREKWPAAHIAILARDYAREILTGSGLVDEVIVCDLPWTAQRNKYRLNPATMTKLRDLVRHLRAQRFDVTLDARMDVRTNLLAAATGAPRRIGYDIGGGGWLLTHYLPSDRDQAHRIDDWLALLPLVDDSPPSAQPPHSVPRLRVSDSERAAARSSLSTRAGSAVPTIGYHPGGSHPGKRWPADRFRALIEQLRDSVGGAHVVFLGPNEQASAWPEGATVIRPTLRELMSLLTCCDVFVCNDSGPMHLADALGVPVVAIFEVGNPQWFGPSGERSVVVPGERAGTRLSAAPLDTPPANPVAVESVAKAVKTTLGVNPERVATSHIPGHY